MQCKPYRDRQAQQRILAVNERALESSSNREVRWLGRDYTNDSGFAV